MAHDPELFLRACRGERVPRPPVWLMRQAGRYLPEYREVRKKVDFLTLCRTPELAAQVTLQPVDRLGVDAAILFSDILILAPAMGLEVAFDPGPIVDPPVRSAADVARLVVPDVEAEVPFVHETIRILRKELAGRVPLIGFGAAPFTLAAYLVEGEGSRSFETWKGMLYRAPDLAHALLEKVAAATAAHLVSQARAGAQAIQIFDTWAGLVSATDYAAFSLPYARRVVAAVREQGVPVIYFALDAAHAAESVRACGADVLGVDWRRSLAEAARAFGGASVLQGNLDPCVLLADGETVRERTVAMLREGAALPGHIANLGHGILPSTPVESAIAFVETVRGFRG
ncbi:MAG TPA: uroporphyrinogen decarboxylase [Candidatus Polarisedimenticolaceae bacterium]|nr:uroporphyrinogen decarboxylase [Candidatus Polarisedimenticolaceae bacterium]